MTSESEPFSKPNEKIKPKISILPDGQLAILKDGNEAYHSQQEQQRQSAIGDRKHFGPRDRGETFEGKMDGEPFIDDEQNTDIIAAELEERVLDNPDDESVKQMLDFIKSLHPTEAAHEDVSIFGLGHKKLEAVQELIDHRPMSLEDKRKLEAQAQNMKLALNYYGDRLQRISGEQMDAKFQVTLAEDESASMSEVRMRTAARHAATRILDEHNARIDRNRTRKAS